MVNRKSTDWDGPNLEHSGTKRLLMTILGDLGIGVAAFPLLSRHALLSRVSQIKLSSKGRVPSMSLNIVRRFTIYHLRFTDSRPNERNEEPKREKLG